MDNKLMFSSEKQDWETPQSLFDELKIYQEYFEAVKDGRKKFEIRKNDRNFQEGDVLILKEYDPITQLFSGEIIKVEVTYMTDWEQKEDYVVLSIDEIWEVE